MKLLVSVTSFTECEDALKGGADILDIKDPSEGSLGAPNPKIIADICNSYSENIPVSVAIGDFPHLPNSAALAALGAAGFGAQYIKIGLYGSKNPRQVREILKTVNDSIRKVNGNPQLIAASYADFQQHDTINPLYLPELAYQTEISGCMIDTYDKQGTNLFDFLSVKDLKHFVSECRKYNLISALAGSINLNNITDLHTIAPEIIGVRGAVCSNSKNRMSKLSLEKVAAFKKRLRSLCSSVG